MISIFLSKVETFYMWMYQGRSWEIWNITYLSEREPVFVREELKSVLGSIPLEPKNTQKGNFKILSLSHNSVGNGWWIGFWEVLICYK